MPSRVPFYFYARLEEGAELNLLAGVFTTVMLSKTQLSVLAFHVLKPPSAYNDTSEVIYPDPCASFFADDCSYRYAELLASKAYEGLVHLYMNGNFESADDFDEHVMNLHKEETLRQTVLADMFPMKDFSISIIRGSTSNIIGVVYDMKEKIKMEDIYGVPVSVYAFNVTVQDVYNGFGKVTKLGDMYEPYDGIDVDDVVRVFSDRGSLPNVEDRWLDFTLESNHAVFVSRQHLKTFVLDGEYYYLAIDASGVKPNTKCYNGCSSHSHCAEDGMFCVCDFDAVLTNIDGQFGCEPLHDIQSPPKIRILFYICFGVCMVGTLVVSFILFWKRKTKLMRLSSYPITQVIIIGVLMLYLGALSFAFPVKEYHDICGHRPFWMISGLTLSLLALNLKTWRIQRLVNNMKMKRMKLHNAVLLKYMAIMSLPAIILLIIWLVIQYPSFGYYETTELIHNNPSYPVCSERNGLAACAGLYLVFLMYWGAHNAKKSFNVPRGANESSAILKTLLVFLTCGVIFVPLNYMVEDSNQELMVVIRAFGALVCGVSVIIAIVGQKLIWLARGLGNSSFVLDFNSNLRNRGSIVHRMGGYKNSSSVSTKNSTIETMNKITPVNNNTNIKPRTTRINSVASLETNISEGDNLMVKGARVIEYVSTVAGRNLPFKQSNSMVSHTAVREVNISP